MTLVNFYIDHTVYCVDQQNIPVTGGVASHSQRREGAAVFLLMGCLAVASLHFYRGDLLNKSYLINNHYRSRTEWSPILSVIIQVIKKNRTTSEVQSVYHCKSPNC